MKKKAKANLHKMTTEELQKELADNQKKLAELGISRYTKQSKNVRERKALRNHIAVMQTILREKELYEKENSK